LTSRVGRITSKPVKQLDKSDPANQLRALRWALGQNFKPMPADELADLINIPPVAIRAVESRRRKLSEDDRLNIEMLLGAVWNAERKEWLTIWDDMPYTREKFEMRQAFGARGPDVDDVRAEYHRTVDLYLDRLEPPEMYLALTKLYRELRRIADQDKVNLGALKPKRKGH
jgi:hypothetical protein